MLKVLDMLEDLLALHRYAEALAIRDDVRNPAIRRRRRANLERLSRELEDAVRRQLQTSALEESGGESGAGPAAGLVLDSS